MIRKLLPAAGLYAGALLTPRVLRLVLIPFVISAVGFQAYGAYVLLSLVLPFALLAADAGTGAAVLRLAPHEPDADRRQLYASMFAYRLAAAALLATVLTYFRSSVAQVLTGSTVYAPYVVYLGATLLAVTLSSGCNDQLRSEERHTLVAGMSATRDVLEAGATLYLVVILRLGVRGLILARLSADVITALYLAFQCRRSFVRPRADYTRTLLRLGAPMATLYLLVFLRDVDRYVIKEVLGVADAGRYDLALRIVGPVALGNTALTMVLEPHVYRTYQSPRAAEYIAWFLRVYVALFATLAFALSAIAPEIFPLLSRDPDVRAAVIAPSLVFAFVGEGILRVAGLGADLAKQTRIWIVVSLVHVLVALPATYLLLRSWGILAAGVALLAGTLCSAQVARALSRRVFALDVPVSRATVVVLIGVAVATLLVGGAGPIAPLPVRLAAVPLFLAVAWVVLRPPLAEVRALLARS